MKKMMVSIALVVGMLAGGAAHSQNMAYSVCASIETIAENVMAMRQLGASEHMVRASLMPGISNRDVKKVLDAVINDAYARPVYDNDYQRDRAAESFAREKHQQCLVAFGEAS